ncbi:hypothetical protein PR202_gb16330 [Eleusine coracana subsp. coracana]|uniref:Uncharacterized protein n=1 Tax=Eleusine coracana subsp. coracana TaxID=191504 RepID=A0AAV5F1N6_ELECO|nr:hypothetical protein PR202_gb16330 [Eleusine coracana subsp. coracana]
METAHEVAVYIDRFHNLDLFQQGWYRMKISATWEEDEYRAPITPARVTQYEGCCIVLDDAEIRKVPTLSVLPRLEHGVGSKSYDIVKGLLSSREMLLEELKKTSSVIGSTLEDLDDADLTLGKYETVQSSKSGFSNYRGDQHRAPTKFTRQMTGSLREFLESSDGVGGSTNDIMLYTLSTEELLDLFETVSCQLSLIWNAFLKFHR